MSAETRIENSNRSDHETRRDETAAINACDEKGQSILFVRGNAAIVLPVGGLLGFLASLWRRSSLDVHSPSPPGVYRLLAASFYFWSLKSVWPSFDLRAFATFIFVAAVCLLWSGVRSFFFFLTTIRDVIYWVSLGSLDFAAGIVHFPPPIHPCGFFLSFFSPSPRRTDYLFILESLPFADRSVCHRLIIWRRIKIARVSRSSARPDIIDSRYYHLVERLDGKGDQTKRAHTYAVKFLSILDGNKVNE